MSATDIILTLEKEMSEVTTVAGESATNLAEKALGKSALALPDALLISVVGFAVVFAVLGFLAIFVFGMGKFFDSIQKKKKEDIKEEPVQNSVKTEGYPLPDNQSMGDLTLVETTEEEAAVIMAITSNKLGIPLNRLKFNSIKLLEDDKK